MLKEAVFYLQNTEIIIPTLPLPLALGFLGFLGRRNELSKEDRGKAEEYGGTDIDSWREYSQKDRPSCDKGGHRERSIANDPRSGGHREHWKKHK